MKPIYFKKKLKVEARIRIQNILDSDFCSRNENLQNALCLECILHFPKSQPNTSDFLQNAFYA